MEVRCKRVVLIVLHGPYASHYFDCRQCTVRICISWAYEDLISGNGA